MTHPILNLAERGFHITRIPFGFKKHGYNGWQNSPRPTLADLETAVEERSNFGVLTGDPSGVFVLDIDPRGGAIESMRGFVERYGPMPETLITTTPSGGWHYYFEMPGFEVRNTQAEGNIAPGLDIRGTGGYVVGPGSWTFADEALKQSEGWYQILNAAPAGRAPEWLREWLWEKHEKRVAGAEAGAKAASDASYDPARVDDYAAYERSAVNGNLQRLAECRRPWEPGAGWDITTFEVACSLLEIANAGWSQLTGEQVEALLLEHAPQDGAWGPLQIQEKLASARRRVGAAARPTPALKPRVDLMAGAQQPLPRAEAAPTRELAAEQEGEEVLTLGDLGNAERVMRAEGHRLRFVRDADTWAEVSPNGSWYISEDAGQRAAMRALVPAAPREMPRWRELLKALPKDDDATKALGKAVAAWAGATGVTHVGTQNRAAIALARTGRLDVAMADFDARPELLAVRNGVIDLRTGALLASDPTFLLTKVAPITYDPSAQAPWFHYWLGQAQPELDHGYLQRVIGATLTGESLKSFFVHEGVQNAGKSMLLDILTAIMGAGLSHAINENLVTGRAGVYNDSYARAALRGVRLSVLDETSADGRAYSTSIKSMVGGGPMNAREPRGKEFTYIPTFKLHIATNAFPLSKVDPAFSERMHLIRWNVDVGAAARREVAGKLGMDLKRYLLAHELPGILNWAIGGAVAWYAEGGGQIEKPLQVEMAVAEHASRGDMVSLWLTECTVPAETGSFGTTEAYKRYVEWCSTQGVRDVGTRDLFSKRLSEVAVEFGIERTLLGGAQLRLAGYRGRALTVGIASARMPPEGLPGA